MLQEVENLNDIAEFFLANSDESLICIDRYGNKKECFSYLEARAFIVKDGLVIR